MCTYTKFAYKEIWFPTTEISREIKPSISQEEQTEKYEHGDDINNCTVHTEQEQRAATTLLDVDCVGNVPTFEDKAVQVDTYIESWNYDVSDIININYRIKSCTGVANIAFFKELVVAVAELTPNGSKFPMG